MVNLQTDIQLFGKMGEKTGWHYIEIPADVAQQIKPDTKVSYRVKGFIDHIAINGKALTPMGEGNFILAIKNDLRKALKKAEGEPVMVQLEEDKDFKIEMPEDLEMVLSDEKEWIESFLAMPKSYQNYYIKWINEAKTMPTRVKRLGMVCNAMANKLDFGGMLRAERNKK